jgi:hypothetical protein
MTSIFIAQFFNTAILLLLVNANFKYSILYWVPLFDKGLYPDLTQDWYNDIGSSLVTTMLTASVFPIIEFFISFGMRSLFRLIDRCCKNNQYRTKSKTIQ